MYCVYVYVCVCDQEWIYCALCVHVHVFMCVTICVLCFFNTPIIFQNILDYIEYLDVDRIRKIYSILSMLAYTIDTDTDSSLHDELETIIRKQLHHTDET